jgi:hypothetical protein
MRSKISMLQHKYKSTLRYHSLDEEKSTFYNTRVRSNCHKSRMNDIHELPLIICCKLDKIVVVSQFHNLIYD